MANYQKKVTICLCHSMSNLLLSKRDFILKTFKLKKKRKRLQFRTKGGNFFEQL